MCIYTYIYIYTSIWLLQLGKSGRPGRLSQLRRPGRPDCNDHLPSQLLMVWFWFLRRRLQCLPGRFQLVLSRF